MKTLLPMKAEPIDDDAFRLLAFPFTGPIPKAGTRGVDLDGEYFSERTDIKADWLPFRPTDWHHGADPTGKMGRSVLGKAIDLGRFEGKSDEPDEDGWWVTVWLAQGEKRVDLIRRLAARGAAIYGSSESIPGMTRKAESGEIMVWPYWRQTLSTSPQNTHSIIRPLKATLDEIADAGQAPSAAFWSDMENALRSLAPSLRLPSVTGAVEAKAGRVFSARNVADIRAALDGLQHALTSLDEVVRRQPDYSNHEDEPNE
jgi:hypothetical protein